MHYLYHNFFLELVINKKLELKIVENFLKAHNNKNNIKHRNQSIDNITQCLL